MASSSQCGNQDWESRIDELLKSCADVNKSWDFNITDLLREYVQELVNANVSGDFSVNFIQAAVVIYSSATAYGKKVDSLYMLASQLFLNLRKQISSKHEEESNNKSKTKEPSNHRTAIEFTELDDLSVSNNLDFNEDSSSKKYVQKIPMIPLALVPLDSNEKGKEMLYTTKGEELGNKRDFQMNVCRMHSSGCLLLPATENEFFSDLTNCYNLEDGDEDESIFHDPLPDDIGEDIASVEPEARNDCTSRNVEGETESLQEKEMTGFQRRRSMRQIEKEQKMEEQRKTNENNSPDSDEWKLHNNMPAEANVQIQKKGVKLKANKAKKSVVKSLTAEEDKDAKGYSLLGLVNNVFFSAENPVGKKGAVNKFCMNGAFDQLIAEQYSKQKIAMQSFRKRLKVEDADGEVKDELPILEEDGEGDLAIFSHHDDDNHNNNDDDDDTSSTGAGCENAAEDSLLQFENRVEKYVTDFINDAAQFSCRTELSEKVNEWEERIKPVLEEERQREEFDIHTYGTRVIDNFADDNRKQTVSFKDVCKGKPAWEVSRLFLATLQLANNYNVDIDASERPDGLHEIDLTLLSRKRHQEDLDKFGEKGGEH